jgi:hypothetical protein
MHHWTKRLFAIAAPLLLTGCLWGPGKFASDLTLRKDGSFVLDYRGEIVLQTLPNADTPTTWDAKGARCYPEDRTEGGPTPGGIVLAVPPPGPPTLPCTEAQLKKRKAEHDERQARKRQENEQMAKAFGLPGLDDESNRAFAAKLMKYAGWRSVTYRGKGVFDVDYHFEGRATQDFLFPALPDNDLIIPFIALRRRADGSVLVTAPSLTGGSGPLAARAGAAAAGKMSDNGPVSRADGRFTLITDGAILTNNSEDGAAAHPLGRQVRWDVGPGSTKIPEALVGLR